MKNNEIMENVQLNKKDKETGIVLIFIASLIAFAAAVYGAFRFGKKKGAEQAASCDEKKTEKVLKESETKHTRSVSGRKKAAQRRKTASAAENTSAPAVYRPVTPRPVYVVRPLHERKRESRSKRFKRHLCAAASAILVVSMVGSGAMQYIEPSTAWAKDSFTGIGRIVKEHDADEPYIILDIVPADARYYPTGTGEGTEGYGFDISTMGYLVSGQAPIIGDLEAVFKDNEDFFSYGARKDFVDLVTMPNSELGVRYVEGYLGVDFYTEPAGWIKIFGETKVEKNIDSEEDDDSGSGDTDDEDSDDDSDSDTDNLNYATGRFYGKFTEGEGEDYSYAPVGGVSKSSLNSNTPGGYFVHVHNNGERGAYRVSFAPMKDVGGDVIGYAIQDVIELDVAPETSYVYRLGDDGYYYPSGRTVADILGHDYGSITDKKEDTLPEDQGNKPAKKPAATPGNEGDKGEQQNPGEGGGEQQNPGEGGGEQQNPGEGEGEQQSPGEGGGEQQGPVEGGGEQQGPVEGGGEQQSPGEGDDENQQGSVDDEPKPESDHDDDADTQSHALEGGEPIVVSSAFIGPVAFSDGWRLLAEEDEEGGEEEYIEEEYSEEEYSEEDSIKLSPDEILKRELGEDYKEHYAALVFKYDSERLSEHLYWPVDENPDPIVIEDGSGVPYPYDSYNIANISGEGSEENKEGEGDDVELYASQTGSSSPIKFKYVGPGQGTYKLTRTDDEDDYLFEVQGAPVYFRCTAGKDWLKEFVFCTLAGGDNADNDFEIQVITRLASDVERGDVQDADLIFLESGVNNTVLNPDALSMRYITKQYGDISEDALTEILKSAVEEQKPVIVDYSIVEDEDNYRESDYQYLAQAFLKSNLTYFYEKISENNRLLDNLRMNVGDKTDAPEKRDNKYNYVNRNVYVVNGSPLVSGDFPDRFDSDVEEGFEDVLREIAAENLILPEDKQIVPYASKARAVQYIINFSVGIIGDFNNLRVLEIQPSANPYSDLHLEDRDEDNANKGKVLTWKTDAMSKGKQIFYLEEAFSYEPTLKSVAEFNGEWEDINSAYDFVFIGLDGQRLNMNDESETRYNNPDLDGKVYHQGDSSDNGSYDMNDLTTQKMEELIKYMDAGYPVLVEDNCFEGFSAQKANENNVNTHYIQEDSNMYRFLQRAVREDKYNDCIFTIYDLTTGAGSMFMTKVRLDKPRISLADVDENGEETSEGSSSLISLKLDENNEYHGQIRYRIMSSNDNDEYYSRETVIRVYADYNYDGYFADAEEVTEFLNVDNTLDVRIEGMGPGILPWKLEVSDADNDLRRDSVQGCFELLSDIENEIKVLQITEKTGDPSVDLQYMFHGIKDKAKDSLLAGYLRSAEETLNAKMQFETVNAATLEKRLAENSKYLEKWDVVVLTLDDAAGSGTVAQAISEYVNGIDGVSGGRSLLVCGQNPGDNRAGLSSTLLGQMENDRTFVNLGKDNGSRYKRYAGLENETFDERTGLRADKINDGIISQYPFLLLDSNFSFGEETALKASPYLLNFEDQIGTEAESTSFVTVWYTLGGGANSAYGISPKDARNNYYCYSKGNVVYLAQSKYDYTYDSQSYLVSEAMEGSGECKFFVNALIAAYSAGLHNANINIVAGFAPDAADIQTISVPYDEQWLNLDADSETPTFGILDKTVDVFFKFNDNNFAAQKTTLIGFYYEADGSGERELPVDGEMKPANSFQSDIWTVTDNRLVQAAVDELQPGKIYRIKAPVIPLQNRTNVADHEQANKADIYIVLETEYVRGGQHYTIISVNSVSLNRAQLFMLE